jgi:hypothetical protein
VCGAEPLLPSFQPTVLRVLGEIAQRTRNGVLAAAGRGTRPNANHFGYFQGCAHTRMRGVGGEEDVVNSAGCERGMEH